MENGIVQLRAIVHGHVQGVFFRATTKRIAESLGLVGTVKNMPDGTVEIVAQGALRRVNKLVASLIDHSGPGHVEFVDKSICDPEVAFSDFSIIY